MAVGRISGPLLQNNLLRNGNNLTFANTSPSNPLLKIDVANNKVVINGATATEDLHVLGTAKGVVLGIANSFDTGDLDFSGSTISNLTGPINLNAAEAVVLSGFATDNITINDNIISAPNTNSSIDLLPNGAGTVEAFNGLEVFGNLHSNANITADGNITIGNDDSDNLVLNADIATDLIANQNNTFDLGSSDKKWNNLEIETVEATNVFAQGVTVGTTSFHTPQGNIFYVATGGNDANVGDNMYGPLRTVKQALARADGSVQGPVTILIYPGEYEEIFPLTVPTNVTVAGVDFRNTIIKPTAGTNTNNCFLMNGETTVQNLTIKDFFSPGHAFSFDSNTTVTTRSPYVKNVSVITKGSVISASDPRGFAQGDAGKGALVDGASVTSASQEASMLFHSVTFITPGVDALTMTNGVRVEWLNSFTYFANRGMYATNGSTGHLSTDGSTTIFGAELRAIGSANVYGNFGAVGDGSGVLFYLIQHNMAYIGVGKNVTNDSSQVIQSQEITKTNSATIYYQTVDHRGNYRVGDQFFINQDTGETSIVITEAQVDSLNGLTITTGNGTTVINGEQIEVGQFVLKDNNISSASGAISLDSISGQINLLDNTNVTGTVSMTGNFTIGGSAIGFGNEAGDTIDFNTPFSQNLVPDVSGLYELGSSSKKWSKAHLGSIQADDIYFDTNYITTTESNSNLELRANSAGKVIIDGSTFQINNNLQVDGVTNLSTTANTNFITGVLTHAGNTVQVGNQNTTGMVTATQAFVVSSALTLIGSIPDPSFSLNKTYTLTANGVTYTYGPTTNPDRNFYTGIAALGVPGLTLAPAPGTLPVPVKITYFSQAPGDQLVLADTNGWTHIGFTAGVTFPVPTASSINLKDVLIDDNFITTKAGNQNLDIRAHTSGTVIFGDNVDITKNLQINNLTSTNNISTSQDITAQEFSTSNIFIENNYLTTTVSNSDLELRATGTGSVSFEDIQITDENLKTATADIVLTTDANFTVSSTGSMQLPKGTTAERVATAGNIRFNTDSNSFEGYATDNVFFGGIFSADGQTSITADETANNILLTVNGAIGTTDSTKIVGEVNGNGLTVNRLDVDDIYLDNSIIRTSVSNSDLELKRDGTGKAVFGDIKINSNSILNSSNASASFAGTFKLSGTGGPTGLGGWHRFTGGTGIVVPYGDDTNKGTLGIVGDLRWNTSTNILEVFDGTTSDWIPAAGEIGGVDEEFMTNTGQLFSLLLG